MKFDKLTAKFIQKRKCTRIDKKLLENTSEREFAPADTKAL